MNATDARALIAAELADVHTCLPGIIVSYDGEFATVRPTLAKQLANGETLAAPIIARVPVCWPVGDVSGAKALFSVPLKPGDPVLLHFSERALDDWLDGADGPPGDPRQFDLSDAFATPTCRPGTMRADTENVSLQYGPMSLKVSPAGEMTITATALTITAPLTTIVGNVAIAGSLVADNVTAGLIGLETHDHVENVGPPIP